MVEEVDRVVYEVRVEGVEEAVRALREGGAKDVKFIIVTIREVKPWRGQPRYQ